ncbi:hypothetical protein HYV49_00840 [Candidatus Pacearchaeota archaeon]|nr:hypothetical protein [Candidatus Pacearchaeota archaeon]
MASETLKLSEMLFGEWERLDCVEMVAVSSRSVIKYKSIKNYDVAFISQTVKQRGGHDLYEDIMVIGYETFKGKIWQIPNSDRDEIRSELTRKLEEKGHSVYRLIFW